jgi:uncharacterized membrane protein YbhN (UPF0104 family)
MRIVELLRGPVGTFLRYACSLALLAWVAWRVDWMRFDGLRGIDATLAVPAVLIAGMAYPLQAWRWRVLLRALSIAPPARWVHGVFWIGLFYSSLLPGGVASEAIRLMYLWRLEPSRKPAGAASLLADRVLGLAALLALATVALGLHLASTDVADGIQPILLASAAGCALLLTVCWSTVRTRCWEPLTRRLLGAERATLLHDAALALGSHRGAMLGAALLSLAVWLLDFAALWMLARAVGLSIGILDITVAATAAYVAASLPISIGGHGVREASLVGMLVLLGITTADNGPVALLAVAFWSVTVGWSLVGGLVHLLSLTTGWPVERPSAG